MDTHIHTLTHERVNKQTKAWEIRQKIRQKNASTNTFSKKKN